MEIRELAERVLFAEGLDEKLSPWRDTLTDVDPGKALVTPAAPGRPEALRFGRSTERAPLPALGQLEDDEGRAWLLHFFANHELLAAELMALVLLKFPEAPAAFRRGVAHTLREEQMHTRMYRRRLEECGSFFGAQAVNGFFWKSVSSMETPLDYVARLSLTFEQANLDYARFFAKRFREGGDEATAKILERIYRDEIAHVSHGLRWFRCWKDPSLSDWASFRRQLLFPLSPSRAKGQGIFNRDGRRLAGLEADFIDSLEVYTQSKGRTPNVYLFNPQAEWTISQAARAERQGRDIETRGVEGTLRSLGDDLGALALYLARQDDVVLMARKPGVSFLQSLLQAGVSLPEIQERKSLSVLEGRKLGSLRPWAWSPDSEAMLAPLKAQTISPSSGWRPAWSELHSKAFSCRLAEDCGEPLGLACRTMDEVGEALAATRGPWVFKAPFGVAGKGLRILRSERAREGHLARARRCLAQEGGLVVQPWIDRVFDFSAQYGRGLRLLGYVRLHNDARGRFRACSLDRPLTRGADDDALEDALTRLFYGQERPVQRFFEETLPRRLRPHLDRLGYDGPLGVDAMVGRDPSGELRLYPLVEINPRHTMGRVTLELARFVVKGARLRFEILTRSDLQASPVETWSELAAYLDTTHPRAVTVYQDGHRCLREGLLVLNDPDQAEAFLAVLRVGQSTDSLLW